MKHQITYLFPYISSLFFQQWQLQVQFVCTRPFCCELPCEVLLLVVGFVSVFMDSAQECMPVKTVCVRTDDAPWMTNEIRLLIKQRVKMHKKAITNTGSNLRADWDNFRTFRNNVISKVRKRKLDYFDELTEKNIQPGTFRQQGLVETSQIHSQEKKVSALRKSPQCLKMEQLFMQIKKRQIHLMNFSSNKLP